MTHQTVSLEKYWKLFPTTLKEVQLISLLRSSWISNVMLNNCHTPLMTVTLYIFLIELTSLGISLWDMYSHILRHWVLYKVQDNPFLPPHKRGHNFYGKVPFNAVMCVLYAQKMKRTNSIFAKCVLGM